MSLFSTVYRIVEYHNITEVSPSVIRFFFSRVNEPFALRRAGDYWNRNESLLVNSIASKANLRKIQEQFSSLGSPYFVCAATLSAFASALLCLSTSENWLVRYGNGLDGNYATTAVNEIEVTRTELQIATGFVNPSYVSEKSYITLARHNLAALAKEGINISYRLIDGFCVFFIRLDSIKRYKNMYD